MQMKSTSWKLACTLIILSGVSNSQSGPVRQSLTLNGHSGEALVYHIDGKTYVDLESLVRIANGTMSFQGDRIILHLPASEPEEGTSSVPDAGSSNLTQDFMRASVQTLTVLKDWSTTIAYAIQRGVPGDGSRIVLFHDRAADALRLTKIAASSNADQDALQLLTNHFNTVNAWSDKLIGERKRMDTGKYSLTPDALKNDETYQKISDCTKFLSTMLPNGVFQDDYACR